MVFRVVNESFLWNCLFTRTSLYIFYLCFHWIYMHLADAFIQTVHSVYSAFRLYVFLSVGYMCSLEIEPTTFALLTQCSTTEPQGHGNFLPFQHVTALEYIFNMTLWTSWMLWISYISLLIIPCIIYHVTNKETLNLERMWKSRIIFMNEINTNILLLERTRWMDQSDHSPDLLNVI